MINKRKLNYLEGLSLLVSIDKTESKRRTALNLGISIDTASKYISLLEDFVGSKLLLSLKQRCVLTPKAKELVERIRDSSCNKCVINNRFLDLFCLKNIKAVFYLKAVDFAGNKRAASQLLTASVETINAHIKYLETYLQSPLICTYNQGSYLTSNGQKILFAFDKLLMLLETYEKKNIDVNDMRIAINNDIFFVDDEFEKNIVIFASNPFLHPDDCDITITYFEPNMKKYNIIYEKEVSCGFFASGKYLEKYGLPKDLVDVQKNHRILAECCKPYARKEYQEIIKECNNICQITNSNVVLRDMVKYGAGLSIMPLFSSGNELIHLEHLPCNVKATLYLVIHKNINLKSKHNVLIDSCQKALDRY